MRKTSRWFATAAMLLQVCSAAHGETKIDVRNIPLGDLVDIYYRVVSPAPYVVCPEVGGSLSRVSVRAPASMTRQALSLILKANGFSLSTRAGMDLVCGTTNTRTSISSGSGVIGQLTQSEAARARADIDALPVQPGSGFDSLPAGSPLGPGLPARMADQVSPPSVAQDRAVFRLRYRTGSELLPLLASAGLGAFTTIGRGEARTDGTAMTTLGGTVGDILLWTGVKADRAAAESLLKMLDVEQRVAEVEVVAVAVSDTKTNDDALGLVGQALGLNFAVGSAAGMFGIPVDGAAFSFSRLSTDRHLSVMHRWAGTMRTGSKVVTQAGGSVPVLSSTSVSENGGRATQSVSYQPTGLTVTVDPIVLDGLVRLQLNVTDSTVVSGSSSTTPAFEQRSMSGEVSVCYGCVALVSRVDSDSADRSRAKAFGLLPLGSNKARSASKIIYLVRVGSENWMKSDKKTFRL